MVYHHRPIFYFEANQGYDLCRVEITRINLLIWVAYNFFYKQSQQTSCKGGSDLKAIPIKITDQYSVCWKKVMFPWQLKSCVTNEEEKSLGFPEEKNINAGDTIKKIYFY